MPRRQRTQPHLLRKRPESSTRTRPAPPRERRLPESPATPGTDANTTREAAIAEALTKPVTPAPPPTPYIRRQPAASSTAGTSTAPQVVQPAMTRANRFANTDYGYVLNELKRIAITGSGIVVLLLILSRIIH